jgi:hypothetical protein
MSYVDPGSASLLIQTVIAAFLAAAVMLRKLWAKTLGSVVGFFKRQNESGKMDNDSRN